VKVPAVHLEKPSIAADAGRRIDAKLLPTDAELLLRPSWLVPSLGERWPAVDGLGRPRLWKVASVAAAALSAAARDVLDIRSAEAELARSLSVLFGERLRGGLYAQGPTFIRGSGRT
jgi:hypothetical protein